MYSVATQKQFLDQRDKLKQFQKGRLYVGEPLFLRSIRALDEH